MGHSPWGRKELDTTEGLTLTNVSWSKLLGRFWRPAQTIGQEDPLEKKMATHSSILAWRIPWTEEVYSL